MEENLLYFHKSLLANPKITGIPTDYNVFKATMTNPQAGRDAYKAFLSSPYIKGLPGSYDDFMKTMSANEPEVKTEPKTPEIPKGTMGQGIVDASKRDFSNIQIFTGGLYNDLTGEAKQDRRNGIITQIGGIQNVNNVYDNINTAINNLRTQNSDFIKKYSEIQKKSLTPATQDVKQFANPEGGAGALLGAELSKQISLTPDESNFLKENKDKYTKLVEDENRMNSYLDDLKAIKLEIAKQGENNAANFYKSHQDTQTWGDKYIKKGEDRKAAIPERSGFWYKAGEQIPFLAQTTAAIGASYLSDGLLPEVVAGATMGYQALGSAGGAYDDYKKYIISKGGQPDEGTALKVAAGNAALFYLTTKIPFESIVPKSVLGKVAEKSVIQNPEIAINLVDEWAKKYPKKYADFLRSQTGTIAGDMLHAGNAAGMGMASNTLGQTIIEDLYRDPDDRIGLKDTFKGMVQGYTSGLLFGGFLKLGSAGSQYRKAYLRQQDGVELFTVKDNPNQVYQVLKQRPDGTVVAIDNAGKEAVIQSNTVDQYVKLNKDELGRMLDAISQGEPTANEVKRDIISKQTESNLRSMTESYKGEDGNITPMTDAENQNVEYTYKGDLDSKNVVVFDPSDGKEKVLPKSRLIAKDPINYEDYIKSGVDKSVNNYFSTEKAVTEPEQPTTVADNTTPTPEPEQLVPTSRRMFNVREVIIDAVHPGGKATAHFADEGIESAFTLQPDQVNSLTQVGQSPTPEVAPVEAPATEAPVQDAAPVAEESAVPAYKLDGNDITKAQAKAKIVLAKSPSDVASLEVSGDPELQGIIEKKFPKVEPKYTFGKENIDKETAQAIIDMADPESLSALKIEGDDATQSLLENKLNPPQEVQPEVKAEEPAAQPKVKAEMQPETKSTEDLTNIPDGIGLEKEHADLIADKAAKEMGLGTPEYLSNGSFGHAYKVGDKVLKITTDLSEVNNSGKVMGKDTQGVNKIDDVRKIVDKSTGTAYYAILQDFVPERPSENFAKYNSIIDHVADGKNDFVGMIKKMGKMNKEEFSNFSKSILTNHPEMNIPEADRKAAYDYVNSLYDIKQELVANGLKGEDFSNTSNLGYKDGKLKYYDLGMGAQDAPSIPAEKTMALESGYKGKVEGPGREKRDVLKPTETKVAKEYTSVLHSPFELPEVTDVNDPAVFENERYKEYVSIVKDVARAAGIEIKDPKPVVTIVHEGDKQVARASVKIDMQTTDQPKIDLFNRIVSILGSESQSSIKQVVYKNEAEGSVIEINLKDDSLPNDIIDGLKKFDVTLDNVNNKLLVATRDIAESETLLTELKNYKDGIRRIRKTNANVGEGEAGRSLGQISRVEGADGGHNGSDGGPDLNYYISKANDKLREPEKRRIAQEAGIEFRGVQEGLPEDGIPDLDLYNVGDATVSVPKDSNLETVIAARDKALNENSGSGIEANFSPEMAKKVAEGIFSSREEVLNLINENGKQSEQSGDKQDQGRTTGSTKGKSNNRRTGITVSSRPVSRVDVAASNKQPGLSVLREHSVSDKEANNLVYNLKKGPSVFDKSFSEVSPENFYEAISAAKEPGNNIHSASVSLHNLEDYKSCRLLLTNDGKAGVAITKDGDIISAFSYGDGKGRFNQLFLTAIKEGGLTCDCFNTVLPEKYYQFGFVPVSRVRWNEEFKPEDWNKESFIDFNNGEPDVVLMVYHGGDRSTLSERVGKFGNYKEYLDAVPYSESWDDAATIQKVYADKVRESESVQPKATEEPNPTVKIFDRPDMEYPVYRVEASDGKEYFIQRHDSMNGGSAWHQVKKNGKYWETVDDGQAYPYTGQKGYTKAEAIEALTGYHAPYETKAEIRQRVAEKQNAEKQANEAISANIKAAEDKTNTNPTEAQKESGNYEKGEVNTKEGKVKVETPKGTIREGVDKDGKSWSIEMQNAYGYLKKVIGNDGEPLDVMFGKNPASDKVFIVDQTRDGDKFDEHKTMIGFDSMAEAEAAYLSNYEPGWNNYAGLKEMSVADFNKWTENKENLSKPANEHFTKSKRVIENLIKKWTSECANPATIKFVDKQSELPEEYNSPDKVSGVYDPSTNTVYFVTENISDTTEAAKTWIHDMAVHVGLRKLFSATGGYSETMASVYNSVRYTKLMDAIQKAYPELSPVELAEEYIAHKAESFIKNPEEIGKLLLPDKKGWNTFASWIRNSARRIIPNIGISDMDVANIISDSYKAIKGTSTPEKPAPKARKVINSAIDQLENSVNQPKSRPVNVVGADSPREMTSARLSWKRFGVASPQFRNWFGDWMGENLAETSKVIDTDGVPMKVYVNKDNIAANQADNNEIISISQQPNELSDGKTYYANIKKPFDLTDDEHISLIASKIASNEKALADFSSARDAFITAIGKKDAISQTPKTVEDVEDLIQEAIDSNADAFAPVIAPFVKDINGYDGIIIDPSREDFKAVAFDGTQLAEDQGTSWTPDNNIRHRKVLTIEGKPIPKMNSEFDKFREIIQDRMIPVRRLQEEVVRRGGKFDDTMDVYREENRSDSKSLRAVKDYDKDIFEPLMKKAADICSRYKMTLEDVQGYLKAKHAIERNKLMLEERSVVDGSGIKTEDAEKTVRAFEFKVKKQDVDELWNKVKKSTDFVMNRYVNDGFLTEGGYKKMRSMYKNYVPLRGWKLKEGPEDVFDYMDNAVKTSYSPLKASEGRSTEAEDPLATMQSMAHTAIVSGEKNIMLQHAARLVFANKDMKDLFEMKKVWVINTGVTDPNTGKEIEIESEQRPSEKDFEAGKVRYSYNRADYKAFKTGEAARQHEVNVFMSGHKYTMVFQDPAVANAVARRNTFMPGATETAQKIFAPFTRYMSMMATSKNPAFIPLNLIRDFGYTMTSLKVKGDISSRQVFMNYPKAFGTIARELYGLKANKPEAIETDGYYKEFLTNGGETGFVHLKDIDVLQKQLEKKVSRLEREISGNKTTMDGVVNALSAVNNQLENFATLSENSSRFAVYMAARKQGMEITAAIDAAKNVTVNFNRKGKASSLVGSAFAFFNAAVQGGHNFVKLGKDNFGKFALGTGMFTALGYGIANLNLMWGGEDEHGVPYYRLLSDYVKHTNLVLPDFSQKGKFITIPLPHGFRAFYSLGVLGCQFEHDEKTATNAIGSAMGNFMDSLSPINAKNFMINGNPTIRPLVPTMFMPVFDISINQDFLGNEVYNKPFMKSWDGMVADSKLGKNFVAKPIKAFTDALFAHGTNGSKSESKFFVEDGQQKKVKEIYDWNPSKIEHILEGYFGGMGKFGVDLVKTATGIFDAGTEPFKTNNIPVMNKLYQTPWNDSNMMKYKLIKQQAEAYDFMKNSSTKALDINQMGQIYSLDDLQKVSTIYNANKDAITSIMNAAYTTEDPNMLEKALKDRSQVIDATVQAIEQATGKKITNF